MDEIWCAGVDGCRGGWFVVLIRMSGDAITAVQEQLCGNFDEVMALTGHAARIAVDMPIGLLEQARPGGRTCDRAARALLGDRRSSVFTPPARTALSADDYTEALAINRASSEAHLGISLQTFNIQAKIREVDECMTPALQARVVEAHPELAFWALAGKHRLRHYKKSQLGKQERRHVLRKYFGQYLPDTRKLQEQYGREALAQDDVLDACALALTARRIHLGWAAHLPPGGHADVDRKGLRMEIWY